MQSSDHDAIIEIEHKDRKPSVPTEPTNPIAGPARQELTVPLKELSLRLQADYAAVRHAADASLSPAASELDDVHKLDVADLEYRLNTSVVAGLSQADAQDRLAHDGPNVITPPPPEWLRKVVGYLFGGFCWLLWIATLITFLAWKPLGDPPAVTNLALAIVLLVVILLQVVFTAYQDWTSSRVMNSINSMLPTNATVVRGGQLMRVPVASIVVGDLVALKYGDKVPADVRLIEVHGLRLDNSVLTGESEPVTCTVEPTHNSVHETRNFARMGTFVTEGEGLGLAVATGDRTMVGVLAQMAGRAKVQKTILQRELQHFVRIIAALAITTGVVCLIVWAAWLRVDYPNFLNISNMLSTDAGIAVAFVPEGLPIAITLILTIVARRMYRQKVLVKNLTVVETLGCVSVLCSDKTGTLTTNQMVVASVAVHDRAVEVGRERMNDADANMPGHRQLALIAGLCNGATFDPSDDPALPVSARRVNGDATDAAFLRYSASSQVQGLLSKYDRVVHIPFNSRTKYMASVVRTTDGTSDDVLGVGFESSAPAILLVKGAPDVLLPFCGRYTCADAAGTVRSLTQEARDALLRQQEQWSSQGQRVILIARRPLSKQEHADLDSSQGDSAGSLQVSKCMNDLCVVGLVGIMDPPRPETAGVVRTLRGAGVRVFMVTGDFPSTAVSIARQVGILSKPQVHDARALESAKSMVEASLVLTGADVGHLKDAEWDQAAKYDEIVFARTTPEHKLKIVEAMQGRGNVVAVTGDGVNDAPALKNADIGVAMGAGSEVAMEAAAMVLLDSNLASTIEALRQGRTVFENLKKVCIYLLPAGSFAELVPVLLYVFLGVPAPLSSFLMIVVCVLTDMAPAMALMYESGESDLLTRRPRRPNVDALVNWKLLVHAYLFLGVYEAFFANLMYFVYMSVEWGVSPSQLFLAFDSWGVDGYAGLTTDEQTTANETGQCVYFVTLVIIQFGNLFATRTRKLSVLQQSPLKNWRLFVAMCVSVIAAVVVLYGPAIQDVFGTHPIPAKYWFIPFPIALGLLALDELRKLCVRTRPHSLVAWLAW